MRATLQAPGLLTGCLDAAKQTIEGLGSAVAYESQGSRAGGGVTALLVVDGERATIGKILDLIIDLQLDGFTEFGPSTTMATGNVTCRVATHNDEVWIVFAEVALEVPTAARPGTKELIHRLVESGQSLVAVDTNRNIVGYALAEPHDANTLSLFYLGVSKTARGQHACSSLVAKLKGIGAAIIADVRWNNTSSMVERFEHFQFVKTDVDAERTKFRWQPAKENSPA